MVARTSPPSNEYQPSTSVTYCRPSLKPTTPFRNFRPSMYPYIRSTCCSVSAGMNVP